MGWCTLQRNTGSVGLRKSVAGIRITPLQILNEMDVNVDSSWCRMLYSMDSTGSNPVGGTVDGSVKENGSLEVVFQCLCALPTKI